MEQLNLRVRKWGNSFGIVLPRKIVNEEKIREGSEVSISLQTKRKTTVGDVMELSKKLGLNKKLKHIDTQKVLKEIDKELWPEED